MLCLQNNRTTKWQQNDNKMTTKWQRNDNEMTTKWQRNFSEITTKLQQNYNKITFVKKSWNKCWEYIFKLNSQINFIFSAANLTIYFV